MKTWLQNSILATDSQTQQELRWKKTEERKKLTITENQSEMSMEIDFFLCFFSPQGKECVVNLGSSSKNVEVEWKTSKKYPFLARKLDWVPTLG